MVAGLSGEPEPGEPTIQVIDPKTDKVVWGMELTGHQQYGRTHHEVRPMAFEANADGSTKRMFAQATGINAVWVIDWNTRKVVDMLWPPKLPLWKQNADGIQTGDMHGLEVLPDRSAVWASSRLDSRIYGWSLARSEVHRRGGSRPERQLDDADPRQSTTCTSRSPAPTTPWRWTCELSIVAKIKTGARPARISTAILPLDRVNPATDQRRAPGATVRLPRMDEPALDAGRARRVRRSRSPAAWPLPPARAAAPIRQGRFRRPPTSSPTGRPSKASS